MKSNSLPSARMPYYSQKLGEGSSVPEVGISAKLFQLRDRNIVIVYACFAPKVHYIHDGANKVWNIVKSSRGTYKLLSHREAFWNNPIMSIFKSHCSDYCVTFEENFSYR